LTSDVLLEDISCKHQQRKAVKSEDAEVPEYLSGRLSC
jgi:hypothetical protein